MQTDHVAAPCAAASANDPILDAIAEFRQAYADAESAALALGELEGAPGNEFAARPCAGVCLYWTGDAAGPLRPVIALSHDDIDRIVVPAMYAIEWEEHRGQLHAQFDEEARGLAEAWGRTGIGAARRREERASDRLDAAVTRLIETRPTTAAGAAALAAFCAEIEVQGLTHLSTPSEALAGTLRSALVPAA